VRDFEAGAMSGARFMESFESRHSDHSFTKLVVGGVGAACVWVPHGDRTVCVRGWVQPTGEGEGLGTCAVGPPHGSLHWTSSSTKPFVGLNQSSLAHTMPCMQHVCA